MRPDSTRMLRDLSELVAIPTENPPGREAEAAAVIALMLEAAGLCVTLDSYAPGRTNVEARFENGPGPVFAFNTHIDTVPAGDGWSSDPFTLTERDGLLFGLGACDCKGPLVCMIEAIRMLVAGRDSWSGTLLALFVADEEVASEGARRAVTRTPDMDFVIVGEPTSNAVVTAHKGSLRPVIRVFGRATHSGTPHLGKNAILDAGRLVCLVEAEHANRVRKQHNALVGPASLTVTRIEGGHADNVVPGRCDLLLDRRMVPGESEEAVKAELESFLNEAAAAHGIDARIVDYKPTPGAAIEIQSDHPIVTHSVEIVRRHGITDVGPFGFPGGCDLVHLCSTGATGIVLGPGALSVAHQPNEFVSATELLTASLIYRDIALTMLGLTQSPALPDR